MNVDYFAYAIEAAGLVPTDTIHADGKVHRFSATDKRSDSAGCYVLHDDGLPVGVFGCWRTGLAETWCSKAESTLTQAERETMGQLPSPCTASFQPCPLSWPLTMTSNPDMTAVRAAALAAGGLVVTPQFPAARPRKTTDFKDLFSLAWGGAVRECFAEILEGRNHGL